MCDWILVLISGYRFLQYPAVHFFSAFLDAANTKQPMMHQAPKLRFKVSIMCSIFLLCATQMAVMVWVWVFLFLGHDVPEREILHKKCWKMICAHVSVLVHYCALSLPLSPSIFAHLLLLFFSYLCWISQQPTVCMESKASQGPSLHPSGFRFCGNKYDSGGRDSVLKLLAEEYGTEQIWPDLLPVFL